MPIKAGKRLGRTKKVVKTFVVVFFISLIVLAGGLVAYGYSYRDRALLNSYTNSMRVASKREGQIKDELKKTEEEAKGRKIKIVLDDKSWERSFEEVSWDLDEDKTSQEIFAYGHNSNWQRNILPLASSLVIRKEFPLIYTFNEGMVEDWLSSINSEVGTPKTETNLKVKSGKPQVIEPSEGKTIDLDAVKEAIVARLGLDEEDEIKTTLVAEQPVISTSEAEGLKDKAVELTSEEVKLEGPKETVTLSTNTLGAMIELKKEASQERSFLSRSEKLGPVYVSFNREKVREFLEKEADQLNELPKDARFTISDGKVTIKETSSDGRLVKLDEATDEIIETLEAGQKKKIALPSEVEPAAISAQSPSDIEKYGIKELIGSATTDFRNSPENRIHNIKNGVQFISGSLIKPDEEFSTLKQLGKIDASSGYLQELVIKENETVPEFGGGLCQVSTTLFRAAMNTGLKITERQNHSYRVSYYEPPVGMDATIYSPQPDLKFINDTPNYILIQGSVSGNKITFDFYGTKDGRSVETSDPQVYDITSPPPPIYIDDPSLEPGEEKRIDREHSGAKATFNYKVSKNGKVLFEQKFNSSYVPWAAKYLRGPSKPEGQ